jgi:hypothetical protein
MPIGRMWRCWLRKVTGRAYRKRTVRSRSIGRRPDCAVTNPAVYAANLSTVTAYLCKGASRDVAQRIGLCGSSRGGGGRL